MPNFIELLGQQTGSSAASGIVGAGMGLLLEKHNDKRQIKQQQKLTDIQTAAQIGLSKFNYEQQLQMWKDTNYGAQMEQMKKAGINPALLYGMSGGGGATTGTRGATAVTGGQAPTGGGEIMGLTMQRMQLGLMEAQRANIEADTANKNADTANKPKTGQQIEATTASLIQGIENQKTQNALMQAQKAATEINAENIQTQTKLIEDQIQIMDRDVEISNATKEDKITQIKAEAANTILTGEAIKQKIQVDKAQINKMAQDIAQGWQHITIEKFKAEIEANFKGIDKIAGNLIEQLFKKIDTARGQHNDQKPIKIK